MKRSNNKEFSHNEYISISTPVNSYDHGLFSEIVNKGIDSHLEAFVKSAFFYDCGRYYFHFHRDEKHILLRRLAELSTDENYSEITEQWIEDIENYDQITA